MRQAHFSINVQYPSTLANPSVFIAYFRALVVALAAIDDTETMFKPRSKVFCKRHPPRDVQPQHQLVSCIARGRFGSLHVRASL